MLFMHIRHYRFDLDILNIDSQVFENRAVSFLLLSVISNTGNIKQLSPVTINNVFSRKISHAIRNHSYSVAIFIFLSLLEIILVSLITLM